MNVKWVFLSGLVFLLAAPSKSGQALMQQKLSSMNQVLNGLVNQDYKIIDDAAAKLMDISKASTWHKTNDEDFLRHAKNFQNLIENLQEKSKAKEHDGTALSYVALTFSCLHCHQEVRFKKK